MYLNGTYLLNDFVPADISPFSLESAVAFPNLGIQLESTTAIIIPFPFSLRLVVPLGTSKRFIPLFSIRSSSGIFLNEAFHRWSVVYYLGVLSRGGMYECAGGNGVEGLEVHVVFPVSTVVKIE